MPVQARVHVYTYERTASRVEMPNAASAAITHHHRFPQNERTTETLCRRTATTIAATYHIGHQPVQCRVTE